MLTLTSTKNERPNLRPTIHNSYFNFEDYYKTNFDRVKKSVYYMLKDEALAFDLTQDIFIKVFNNINQLKEVNNSKAWLSTVTRNFCIDFLRKEKRRKNAENESKDTVYNYETREDFLEEELLYDELYNKIDSLKEADKDLINRKYFQQQKISKISSELNISPSAVKMRLQRVRDRVKKAS